VIKPAREVGKQVASGGAQISAGGIKWAECPRNIEVVELKRVVGKE
jgi:hypothetical protein